MDSTTLEKRLHFLARRLSRAQRDFGLIEDGDRVLVALSGGKDSAALLHVLTFWRRQAAVDFEVAAVHVEVDGAAGNDRRREAVARLAASVGVPIDFVAMPRDTGPAPGGRETHPCFRCAWHRRESLFHWAGSHGFGKLALGHHLDDAAETVLMNLLYKGGLDGMAPRRVYFGGKVTLIRPLILAEEKELARVTACLDHEPSVCACDLAPGGAGPPDSARQHVKAFLRSLGKEATAAKRHLWRASLPAMGFAPPRVKPQKGRESD